jgi:hypothetical protein
VRLPVVLITEDESLPFDVAQQRTVFFDGNDLASAGRAREFVTAQLRTAFEQGEVRSPVTAAADLASLRTRNADPGRQHQATALEAVHV